MVVLGEQCLTLSWMLLRLIGYCVHYLAECLGQSTQHIYRELQNNQIEHLTI